MDDNDDNFDVLLTSIGFGRWQVPIILTTILVAAQLPVHLVGSPFVSAPMDFHCSPTPPLANGSVMFNVSGTNGTYYNNKCLEVPVNISMDMTADIYNGTGYFTGLPTCPYIEYDTSIFSSTINSDWHIVCDQDSLRPMYQTMYSIGGLMGSSLSGYIGDRFGRKRSVQVGCIGHLIAVMLTVTVPSYSFILVMRMVFGITMIVMLLPAWNLALEVTPSRHRSLVGMLLGLPYSFFVAGNASIAYFVRTWQYLLLAGVSPGLLLFPLAMYIDESPRWLIQKQQQEKATKVLKNAVKFNNVKLREPVDVTVKKLIEATKTSEELSGCKNVLLRTKLQKLLEYIRSPAMMVILILSPMLWFLQSFLYLSIAINANNFTTSGPFLYVALTGLMDGSAIILSTPLATRLGRRVMIFAGMFGGGVCFLLELLIPSGYDWARWILVMVGFLLVGGSFQVNYIYGPELFPTEIRTTGFGFLHFFENIGFICTPFVTENLAKYAWWTGGVFFGVSGLLGSLTLLALPETRNKPLPDTLQDVENKRRNKLANKDKKNTAEENKISDSKV
ncbi:organic cation transporter protein-like [Palaemon carinicauda]|uniref:organic cation transporter protein-like n=1 Tax=Palaemon carinicauda TaxID=392227 RepID=UPI0035B67170